MVHHDKAFTVCCKDTSLTDVVLLFQKILQALKRVTQNRTTIVIAHRLATVVDADIILVLKNGRVAEQGNHFSLISNPDSFYSELWRKQNQPVEEIPMDEDTTGQEVDKQSK